MRVALVTGGGRGIGRAIALVLARDGHAVAVGDLDAQLAGQTVTAVEAADGRGLTLALDVTDSASVAAAVARTADELGAVDILVNNAGWDELRPFVETDEAFWDRVIDINCKGCLRMTHAVLPGMVERGWGRIVNARRVHHGPDVVGQRRADDGLSRADAATPR